MIFNFYSTSLIFLAGFCLFSALSHFAAQQSGQQRRVHLLFAAITLSLIGTILTGVINYNTSSLSDHITWGRVNVAFNIAMYTLLPWFFAVYSGVRAKPVLIGSAALCVLLFFINLIQPNTLLYSEVHGINRLILPWGEEVFLIKATPSIWGGISFGYVLFVPIFGLYAFIKRYRLDRKSSTLFMIFAVAILLFTLTQNMLVRIAGIHNLPPLGSYGFLSVVIIMGMTLTRELREYRKRAEEALQQSERKTRAILDQSFMFIGLMSTDGILLDTNRAALELVGVTHQDVYNKPFWESPWWNHSVELQNKLRESIKLAAAGEEVRFETSHQAIDGSLRYVDFSLRPVKNEHGDILYLIPEGHDITERKLAEKAFLESEEKYRYIVENAPIGIFQRNLEGQFEYCNLTLAKHFECGSIDEFLQHYNEISNRWANPDNYAEFKELLVTNGKVLGFETETKLINGKTKWFSLFVDLDSSNSVLNGFSLDITERKKAEKLLQESENNFKLMIANSPDTIIIQDINGSATFVSNHVKEMFGYEPETFIGKPIPIEYIFPDDIETCINAFKALQAGTEVVNVEYRFIKATGEIIWLNHTARPIIIENVISGIQNNVRDITERKKAEEDIKFQNILLKTNQELSLDGILIVDEKGNILSNNKKFQELWEIPQEVIDSKSDENAYNSILHLLSDPKAYIEKIEYLYRVKIEKSFDEIQLKNGKILERYSAPMLGDSDQYFGRIWFFRDITEQKLAEQALKKSEGQYRTLFAEMREGFALHDIICDEKGTPVDYRYLDINPAFERLTGLKSDVVIGKTVKEILPNTETYWIERFGKVAMTGKPAEFEDYSAEFDSYYRTNVFCPQIGKFAVLFEDITKRKKAEQLLQDTTAKLESIINVSPLAITLIDINGNIQLWNKAAEQMFGWTAKEVIGHPNPNVPVDKQIEYAKWSSQILQGESITNQEAVRVRKNGSLVNISISSSSILDVKGNLIGRMAILTDITERKKNEENLIKLYTAINSSKASIVITDIDGNIEFANPYFTELTSYSEDEYLGKNPRVLKSGIHSVEYYKTLWDTIKSGNTWEGEFCNRKKNGELYWEKSIITPIKNEKEEIINFVAVKSDISHEKKHEHLDDITLEIYERSEYLTVEEVLKLSIELGIQLTDSEIGFFHFVNEDQETISLQAWSAKTMDICNVPTLDKHYPISKAGVWVDCFYQKNPVYHNDYSSLSHKKGLPEGHATLARDLSVPVIVENKIVAIFGVGNKETDYTEIDAEFLSVFAENVWNVVRRKKSEFELIDSKDQIHRYASHLQNVREEEKISIAREIHDDLGQILVGLQINMGLLKNKVIKTIPLSDTTEILPKVDNITDLIKKSIKTARNIMNGLRPEFLEVHGLVGAINEYLREFKERHEIDCEFTDNISDIELDPQQSLALFRILQEAMNNIVKHAKATLIKIHLHSLENKVVLQITDNGVGFDKNNSGRNDSYGMIGMKERVVLLKGELDITSEIGRGTTVKVEIPF